MRRPKDKLFAGIDLHSNNVMIAIINQDGKRDCDADSFFNRYNHGDSKLYGRKGRGLLCIPPAGVKFANFRIFIGFRG